MDDIFLIWQHTEIELDAYIAHLNTCLPTINFTMEKSKESVCFLDTIVKIVGNRIETDLYSKPTDAHNYLLYKSAHPKKCKDSIPYSQFLRIRRICTQITDYDKHVIEYCTHFQRRGYPTPLLESAALAARRLPRNDLLTIKTIPTEEPVKDNIVMVMRDLGRKIADEGIWRRICVKHYCLFEVFYSNEMLLTGFVDLF